MTEEDRINDVLAILPDLDVRRVRVLLNKYGSAEAVINRCLDGQIEDDDDLPPSPLSPQRVGEDEVVELNDTDSTVTTSTAEYDTNPFEIDNNFGYNDGVIEPSSYPKIRTIEVHVGNDEESSQTYDNDLNQGDDLPDIPEVPAYKDDDFELSVPKVTNSQPPAKAKRGRKKKEEIDEANKAVLAKVTKKKLPKDVASIEIQMGTALIDKSVSQSAELTDALLKALDVNGGIFEKNAALPCPCNVTLWEDAPHPCAIRWIYHRPLTTLDNDEESSDVVYAAPGSEFCAELQPELCIMLSLDDFANLCRSGNHNNDLASFSSRFSRSSTKERYSRLILITPDPEQYFKQRLGDQRRQFRQKMTSGEQNGAAYLTSGELSLEDIEMAISSLDFVDPPLDILVTVKFSTTSEHAAAIVRSLTKAMCERPAKAAKRQWDSALVMEPGNTVNPTEKPLELWLRQLEQISLVSGDVASAIAARYPTPMSLHCAATAEGHAFATDLEIRRGAGVLERTRRVGPETSRRLHMLFTTGVDSETIFE